MAKSIVNLPPHLSRYVVEQDYSRYSSEDQAVWRHILRQLVRFLSVHAHPCYREGLNKTGITLDRIPQIDEMSSRLQDYGWTAVAVSGFIPPAAFMELQSLGVLPIACDIRTKDHLLYTPAPDIVHEAAGHAPILIDPTFADYLKRYADVAKRAIISRKDMDQYDAIRILSDLKEDPHSTVDQIRIAENRLKEATEQIKVTSEAALLGRMNWWTAEYGLIGSLENPKIFGAGLLSSVGESRHCLGHKVRKIPLSIECLDYSYDITEPQPQLFVAEDFNHLHSVLDEMKARLSYQLGGITGLSRALESETVNTIELDTGLQLSGVLAKFLSQPASNFERQTQIRYLQLKGPTQLSIAGFQVHGQGAKNHPDGYGTALGPVRWRYSSDPRGEIGFSAWLQPNAFDQLRFDRGREVTIEFERGILLTGFLESETKFIKTFKGATVLDRMSGTSDRLFAPEWGTYDLAIGSEISSVFAGPADRAIYPDAADFPKRVVQRRPPSDDEKNRLALYSQVTRCKSVEVLQTLIPQVTAMNDWLLSLETLNAAESLAGSVLGSPDSTSAKTFSDLKLNLRAHLAEIGKKDPHAQSHIEDALHE